METSIDEGLETEGEAEEDPSQAFDTFQSTRSGQRRHTLSEVTNQLVMMPGSGTMSREYRLSSSQHHLMVAEPGTECLWVGSPDSQDSSKCCMTPQGAWPFCSG